MADSFLFIKVDHGFPEHPHTVGLSDKAFRAVVELWCYCHRATTDGLVPMAIFNRYPAKVRQELLVHYVEPRDGNRVFMHNYAKEQQTSESIDALKESRRKAGSAGGKARAKNLANAQASAKANGKQDESKIQPDLDIDIDIEKERGAKAPVPRSRAVALPADFEVNEAMKAWAREKAPGIDLAYETEKFKNFHMSKGSTFKDWQAAWRTWIGKAVEFSKSRPPAFAGRGPVQEWD